MNVLDIFKYAVETNPENTYIECFESGDFRLSIQDTHIITINENRLEFKGKVLDYDSGIETITVFWNEQYYCSNKDFQDFLTSLNIPEINYCPKKGSLKAEKQALESFGIEYILE